MKAGLIVLVLILASITGWVLNIIDVAGSNFGEITGLLVLRVIGIFLAPLGAVLGLFT